MALRLAETAVDFSHRRRRWILFLAAAGLSGYGAYRVYHLPSVTAKRKKLAALLRALVSVAESAASSAETIALVSSDLNRFLRSDCDEVPASLKQLSKIARSDEFSASLSSVSESLTVGIIRGLRSTSSSSFTESSSSGFSDKLLDKLFSASGSGFASVVVGSFARNLVIEFYSSGSRDQTESSAVLGCLHVSCSDKCRELIADCIQHFVSAAVAVYLDKTMEVNTYDEIFAGLTNPKHESKVKDLLVSVCNGAVETLVKTSHRVLMASNSSSSEASEREVESSHELNRRNSYDCKVKDGGRWVDQVSSTLAVPSNRRFVLDVTGRVTFETVRSFLDFLLWRLYDGARKGVNVVREEVVERGLEVVRFISAKSMAIIAMCFTLCMHVLMGTRFLMPA